LRIQFYRFVQAVGRELLVADNCSDATAERARAGGAEVVERRDSTRRGKSYALEYGVQHLAENPPEVVVFLDADCRLHDGSLDALTEQAAAHHRPTQAIFLMQSPAPDHWRGQITALGTFIKNRVRPMGLRRMGWPCGLTGSGLALPWPLLGKVSLASGHIVEDLQLGLDFVEAGYPPILCDRAVVTSPLPSRDRPALSQRTRWEHGTLHTLVTRGPRLLGLGLCTGRFSLVASALDLLVPPLTLLLFFWGAVLAMALAWAIFGGSWLPSVVLGAMGALFAGVVIAVWARHFRRELPLWRALLMIPAFMLGKIPIYTSFLVRRQTEWVRTDRVSDRP